MSWVPKKYTISTQSKNGVITTTNMLEHGTNRILQYINHLESCSFGYASSGVLPWATTLPCALSLSIARSQTVRAVVIAKRPEHDPWLFEKHE